LIDARIEFWKKLQPLIPEIQKRRWLSTALKERVESLLEAKSYPPTYPREWIEKWEPYATPWKTNGSQSREQKDEPRTKS